jgi:PqqD family protein of HPr-rel-A system
MGYVLGALAALHWKRWGEEWVLFDEGSGQTVLLDTLSAATLLMLDRVPIELCTLEEQLIEELRITETEGFSDLLQEHLESMIKLGLVESSPC